MGYGLNVINDNNEIVLSNERSSLKLFAEGTAYSSTTRWAPDDPFFRTGYHLNIPIPSGINPLIAQVYVQPLNRLVSPVFEGLTPIIDPFKYSVQVGNAPFKYKVFYPSLDGAISDGSDYGLELYGSSGEVSFSTRHTPLYLEDMIDTDPSFAYDESQPFWPLYNWTTPLRVSQNNSSASFTKTIELAHKTIPGAYYCMHYGFQGLYYYVYESDGLEGALFSVGYRQLNDSTLVRQWGWSFGKANLMRDAEQLPYVTWPVLSCLRHTMVTSDSWNV